MEFKKAKMVINYRRRKSFSDFIPGWKILAIEQSTTEEFVNTRGRAYKCMKCKNYLGERFRVVDHIFIKHTPLDAVPFYCSICKFVCSKRTDLDLHVKRNSKHRSMVDVILKRGQTVDEEASLMCNPNPYLIKDEDMKCLSKEESEEHYRGRSKKATYRPVHT